MEQIEIVLKCYLLYKKREALDQWYTHEIAFCDNRSKFMEFSIEVP